jgi:hypothetical protein
VHQSSLSQELANMGIASREEHHQDSRQLSGSGRGRFGSQHNAYASSLSAKSRGGNWKGDGTRTSKRQCSGCDVANETYTSCTEQADGIISQAIASAHRDQDQDHEAPTTPTKQNGESLLARSPSRRRSSPLPASPTRPTKCSGLNNPRPLQTRCRAHPWPTTRPVVLSKLTLLLTQPPPHHLYTLSNNSNSLANPVLAVPAKSLPYKNVKDVSNKNTQTTTLAQPPLPCGSASSASTRISGALVLKL